MHTHLLRTPCSYDVAMCVKSHSLVFVKSITLRRRD